MDPTTRRLTRLDRVRTESRPDVDRGTVLRAAYDVAGDGVEDHQAEMRIALARQ